jgi:hypothetical protein
MKKTTIVIIIAALVCGGLAVGAIIGLPGISISVKNLPEGSGSIQPEDATTGYLIEIQKNPPDTYIEELTLIIERNQDQAVRDAAVNTLTDIAIRRSETERIMDFLKDLTLDEEDPVIMSAAYASIDLIRDAYPLPPMGSLNLSVRGNVKRGEDIEIIATFSSTQNIEKAVLGLDIPLDFIEPVTPYILYTNLTANTPKMHTFQVHILESGEIRIPVQLLVSTDRTDYEQIDREVQLIVRDTGGEYLIV